MSIQQLIASVGDRLTPTERRIAQAVLEDQTLLAFGTVSDLAESVSTSRPSVVRFAAKLGFEGYTDLQQWARDGVARQLTTPSDRIRQDPGGQDQSRHAIEQSVHHALEVLDPGLVRDLAGPLAGARSVWILSGETSRAGAHALHSGLSMVRDRVHLVEPHNHGRDLSRATREDAAVVFDFARYRRNTVLAAGSLASIGVRLLAITDGPLSPYAAMTPHWCAFRVPAVGPFDSSLPAVLAAELLVHEVVGVLGHDAAARLDRLEMLWESTQTYYKSDPQSSNRNGTHDTPGA